MALPTHRIAAAALAVLLLVPFFGVRTTPVSAQSGSSQHTLTLDPALVHWAAAGFSNSTFDDNECVPDFPDSQIQVGYTHSTDVSSIASDTFVNCVYQTAVRFDLSPVHQYPGAVITSATVHYDEQIIKLRDPNGYEPANGTPDVFPDAVVGTCVGRIGIPTEEWDGTRGLIPNDSDATVQRVAGPVWDVTDQANHWYLYPDDPNLGLMFAGYDEGGEFSNQAECVSVLSHVQLIVELVANDPTSTPTPTFLQRVGDASRASSGALPSPTSTPLVIDVGKLHPIVVQPTPTAVSAGAVSKVVPDLVVTAVEMHNFEPGLGCSDLRFTVHVQNIGVGPSVDASVVSLTADGQPKWTTTVGPLEAGAEATISPAFPVALAQGLHTIEVTVNPARKLFESDYSNNTFTRNNVVCA